MRLMFALFAAGLAGVGTSHATLPPATPEEKAAALVKAQKEAAAKAQAARELSAAQDRAAANFRRDSTQRAGSKQGADHGDPAIRDRDLTREEAQTEMPLPGQANDHSTTARDPRNADGR